jgi:hypothetical protein
VKSTLLATLLVFGLQTAVLAEQTGALRDPLRLEDVLAYAQTHRQEIAAARARVRAAEQRLAIVSGLEDPMVMPSIDHLPFMLDGVDASLMIEQRFPLSGVLGQRKRAAKRRHAGCAPKGRPFSRMCCSTPHARS